MAEPARSACGANRLIHTSRITRWYPLEIESDRGFWRCAADQRVALGGRVQRLWRISDLAFDQATLAVVAYA